MHLLEKKYDLYKIFAICIVHSAKCYKIGKMQTKRNVIICLRVKLITLSNKNSLVLSSIYFIMNIRVVIIIIFIFSTNNNCWLILYSLRSL